MSEVNYIYTLTGIEKMDPPNPPEKKIPSFGDQRCFGYYCDLNSATRSAESNNGDIHEYLYDYLVIERYEEGIYPLAEEIAWYKWDENTEAYIKIDKPELTNHLCNWALG